MSITIENYLCDYYIFDGSYYYLPFVCGDPETICRDILDLPAELSHPSDMWDIAHEFQMEVQNYLTESLGFLNVDVRGDFKGWHGGLYYRFPYVHADVYRKTEYQGIPTFIQCEHTKTIENEEIRDLLDRAKQHGKLKAIKCYTEVYKEILEK